VQFQLTRVIDVNTRMRV